MADEISREQGLEKYLNDRSDQCDIIIRNADDPAAAALGLARFRDDLWTSDIFASLDGMFGEWEDGTVIRYTPASASEVFIGDEGPQLYFDAEGVLEDEPAVTAKFLARLETRLREAGVHRAEIGRPPAPYSEAAYVGEADWFDMQADYLSPVHERWVPPNFPEAIEVPEGARAVVAHRSRDGSWTALACRRPVANDDFSDVFEAWRASGLSLELLHSPPDPPPDIAWNWDQIRRAYRVEARDGGTGWAFVRFSKWGPFSDLHVVWFTS